MRNDSTHFLFCIFFFRKLVSLCDNVEKCGRHQTGDRLQYSAAHALLMLDNYATDTHSEYVILIAFFTCTMVTLTLHFTFIHTLRLWLFLNANIRVLSRQLKVIIVYTLLILQFFVLDVNIFLTLTMYQEKQGFSVLISGSWSDF